MNKVSLNGVEIYPFDSEQSLLSFVNDNPLVELKS